jgi:hypothetical protein
MDSERRNKRTAATLKLRWKQLDKLIRSGGATAEQVAEFAQINRDLNEISER